MNKYTVKAPQTTRALLYRRDQFALLDTTPAYSHVPVKCITSKISKLLAIFGDVVFKETLSDHIGFEFFVKQPHSTSALSVQTISRYHRRIAAVTNEDIDAKE